MIYKVSEITAVAFLLAPVVAAALKIAGVL